MNIKNFKVDNKKIMLITAGIVAFVSVALGLTYAYFFTNVIGNPEASGMVITSDDISIAYEDSQEIILSDMLPGFTSTKTFSVTNNSGSSVKYDIIFSNIESTMVGNDFVYSLTSTNGGAEISETSMPTEDGFLVIGVSVPADTTQTYTMTITYKNMPYPQNENQGAIFYGKLILQSPYTTAD